jgi:hypothetical protein
MRDTGAAISNNGDDSFVASFDSPSVLIANSFKQVAPAGSGTKEPLKLIFQGHGDLLLVWVLMLKLADLCLYSLQKK